MRKIVLTAIFFLSLLSAQKVSISGVVLNRKGKPAKKVKVILFSADNQPVFSTSTDKKGKFLIKDVKADYYFLKVDEKRKGKANIRLKPWPESNRDITGLEIKLSKKEKKSPLVTYGPGPAGDKDFKAYYAEPLPEEKVLPLEKDTIDLKEKDVTIETVETKSPEIQTTDEPTIDFSIAFKDKATELGIDFIHDHGGSGKKYYVETMGSGVCLLDFDVDGDLDIYFCQGKGLPGWEKEIRLENKLFRNDGGFWSDVTSLAGVGDTTYSIGCACGDMDNDGDPDLYVTNYGLDILYRNNGNGTFTDVTYSANIHNPEWGSSAVFFDMDSDGWLDLYVTNYVEFFLDKNPWCGDSQKDMRAYCDPDIFRGIPDKLYRNIGAGHFVDVSTETGIAKEKGKGLGVVTGDVDNDGDIDIYVANDKVMNMLFLNDGMGHFIEDALFTGVGFNENGKAEAGMGLDLGDVNRDGWLDLFVTNFSGESNTLYLNDQNGSFTDKTFSAGLGQPSLDLLGFGTKFLDYNYDGWLDLFVTNGHVIDNIDLFNKDYSHAQRKQIFLNDGTGSFYEIANAAIVGDVSVPSVARGTAFGDLDNDGDMDIVINNNNGPPNLLIREGTPEKNWVAFQIKGRQSNWDGYGAKITIYSESGTQSSYVNPGASYLSSNDHRIFFGLGDDPMITRMKVEWPGGGGDVFFEIELNKFYRIVQGGEISALQP